MTSETEHFENAPIVEALVGVDLEEMLGDDSLDVLKKLGDSLQPKYPTREDIVMGQVEFALGKQPKQIDTPFGYFFKTSDGRQVIHARRNGFAFSRLAPYEHWEGFISEAKRTWILYRQAIGPSRLLKWTVRYINKLSWSAGERMEDYLQVYPHIPSTLPQDIQGCFMRLLIPIHSPQGLLTQQLVLLPPEQVGKVSFMLDNEFTFSAIGLSDPALWERIESSREMKNKFFKDSITAKTKEMIS